METAEKKTDRRIIKTKKAIRRAVVELLKEEGMTVEAVSVTALCRAADINRKTFYTYYYSVLDVITEIEETIVDAFRCDIERFDFSRDIDNPTVIFASLTEIIEADKNFYTTVIRLSSSIDLFPKIKSMLKERVLEYYCGHRGYDRLLVSRIADFVIGGTIDVYRGWYSENETTDIETLSQNIGAMISGAIHSMTK